MTDIIKFLGEDEFLSVMDTENRKWRKSEVVRGSLSSFDGTKLSYYVVTPENPKASITIVHGMGEFFGKYHEYIWYLYQAGYKVFFMEQRGHGYSEGKCKEPDLIYIDDYSTYVEDLNCFVEDVVIPESGDLTMLLFAHSMGGAVATYYLEKHPAFFKAAVLSSPMLKMKAGNINAFAEFALRAYVFMFRKAKSLAPNQKHFNPETPFETSSAKSKPRFDYQLNLRKKDDHYQMTGATFGWALASLKVHRDIFRHIDRIKIPVDIFTAGQDHLIDPVGYDMFKEKKPDTKIHEFPESRHEIFNADETSRIKYFKEIFEVLDSDSKL
ncbi:alpha/beta fold hydrolase [Butyrivibrio proteoclasticus]|uniref:alpha/beta fold hydrolase n=1 Tax=Butyrivibrio proteoclasticus TaxID=43305 RepID=UPI000686D8B4|nr:alpha/beta fold hydrolase [Butyrivibrio proteoclasticus]